jgi:signal peptidase I
MIPDQRYMAATQVACRQATDGAALFNPDTNDLVAINTVGHLIWQSLTRPCTQQEIVAHLVDTCQDVATGQVAVEQVDADVAAFLRMLLPRGFIGLVWEADSPVPDLAGTEVLASLQRPLAPTPPEQEGQRYYHGHSMAGTFQPGDYLTLEPATLASIRPGDVVVYRGHSPTDEPTDVVHRVVAVTPGGLVTRGDNNPGVDNSLVTQDALVGRVTHRERGGRVRRAGAGRWGAIQLRARRAWRRMWRLGWRLLRAVGRPVYRWLRASGLARRLWQPDITRLLVTTGNGLVVKYVHRQRTVARWRPATGSFRCQRPYDLIILRPDGRNPGHE